MSDIRRLHERIADLEVQLSTKMDEITRLTDAALYARDRVYDNPTAAQERLDAALKPDTGE